MTPADRARKILLGTGMCLVFVFAIGLDSGRYSSQPEIGWIFPVFGLLLIGIGFRKGSLGQQFPDESDDEMTQRVHEDVHQTEKEKNVGQAWASLEQHLIKSEIEESE
ncbi:MAG: hypothetical protein ACPHMS_01855 [Candidatus Poseidoniaceae archaeon]